ncbi:UDP-glucose dehydrogenase family protein [Piscinibacter gummiphilus]|uniref:UDP-glucose 6-dehydrogenase n=1 Tax=Piscinibacter gummiphilus TaxID=946333 RepID=A0A1W6LEH7_9BURK|nr:UDP-glucose/GDP-mannose dehydrogenase family protein [Piscinibacter gummiphilus]ARN22633.1 UDP-glucose 6-dehydrogenase [Piscinibacter gummiphilus]ATU67332.1 UDP-glucose/GDP-mannose dehydrogenase family protein [Piscinibacter gummiphilus]GLS97675.1 UDP-glucose dehydrogenase [Piscinibacter gummiphilus]
MKVSVIGTGYVGLVTGACLADMGNDVVCLDIDARKIAILREGGIPIHEPGLDTLVQHNAQAGRLHFTTDAREAALHADIHFIAVGTPPDEDGSADMKYVLAAAREVGRHMNRYCVIVNKSTVPVGTAQKVRAAVAEELAARGADIRFSVVSNPEFLKEGAAIEDFMRPDRIVVGSDDEQATRIMRELYAPFERNTPKVLVMDIASAELTKYAANAMLATRISFMNEMALLAEVLGADIDAVRRGVGSDPRIGSHFLYAGCGYGGSCFPKDVAALSRAAGDAGISMGVLDAVEAANERQKELLIARIEARFGHDLGGRVFALWGLAFKPGTDDMREAPSQVVVRALVKRGATVRAYDPVATDEARRVLADVAGSVEYQSHAMDALKGADALVVVTEWKEFRSPDFDHIKSLLRKPIIFDGRNIFSPEAARQAGFEYTGIGRA